MLRRVRDRLDRISDPRASHGVRAVDRFLAKQGSLLAAAVSYFGFLALLPMVAVALGVTSVLANVAPAVQLQLTRLVPSDSLHGVAVGVVGMVLLSYTGVRWIGALRRSVAIMWDLEPRPLLAGLLRDVLVLLLLAGCLLASAFLTLLTKGFGGHLSALLASLVTNWLVGWVLFRALPHGDVPERELRRAAYVFALGFQVLIQLVTVIVSQASHNVVYGAFAATVGVLIWISYVSRLILFLAAWTATWGGHG